MKNTLLFTYSTNILVRLLTVIMKNCLTPKIRKCALVTLLKMRSHYSQSSCENATSSGGTSQLASYEEVPTPPPTSPGAYDFYLALRIGYKQNTLSKSGAESSLFQFWLTITKPLCPFYLRGKDWLLKSRHFCEFIVLLHAPLVT